VNAPQIASHHEDLGDVPVVRTFMHNETPWIQILDDRGDPLLDMTCVNALNLALLLIQEGGQGLDRRVARTLRESRRSP
jgi:hypothetical protein